jgi:hypothetical protein
MLTMRPGASGIRLLIAAICSIWLSLPLAAILGQVGVLRSTLNFKPGLLIQNGHTLRAKKGALPALTHADLRHAFVTRDGQRYAKRQAIHELSQPGAEASFVLRTSSLHIRPAASIAPGVRPKGYTLVRVWASPPWLWWSWAGTCLVVSTALWRSRWRVTCIGEVKRGWHAALQAFECIEFHPATLVAYAAATSVSLAAANWQKVSAPYLVAEDGPIFIEDNLSYGIGSLFVPYAGYLHMLPRLIVWVGSIFPLESQPAALVWITLGLLSVTLYFIGAWTSWAERIAVAAFFTLAPMGGYLMYSPTNLHWFTGLALALLAVHPAPRPAKVSGQVLLILMATLAALSGPFAIITLPAMIWRAWHSRTRFEIILALSQAIAAIAQISVLTLAAHPPATPGIARGPLLPWVADFALGLFGKTVIWSPGQEVLWGTILAGELLLLFISSLFFWRGGQPGLTRLLWMLAFAALFAAAGWARSSGTSRSWLGGERYYVIPYALIVVALATLLSSRQRLQQGLAAVLLASMMPGLCATAPTAIRPPHWSTKVQEIPPGGHGLIETYPPDDDQWSVFIAKDDEGKALTGSEYLSTRARLDTRTKRPGEAK